jgi:DNA-binding GntR family transcriptional regulator
VRCREHVALADLLLAGDTDTAAAFLREHLATVADEKVHDDEPGEGRAPRFTTASGPSAG